MTHRSDSRMRPRIADGGDHHGDGVLDRHVLPQPHHRPARLTQRRVGGAVPLDVPGQLRRPVPLVVLWLRTVLGAGVPEAAVDEHRHLARGERDIRADPFGGQVEAEILPVSVAHRVQRAAQRQLRPRVGPAIRFHVRRTAEAGWQRVGPALHGVSGVVWRVLPLRPAPFPLLVLPPVLRHAAKPSDWQTAPSAAAWCWPGPCGARRSSRG